MPLHRLLGLLVLTALLGGCAAPANQTPAAVSAAASQPPAETPLPSPTATQIPTLPPTPAPTLTPTPLPLAVIEPENVAGLDVLYQAGGVGGNAVAWSPDSQQVAIAGFKGDCRLSGGQQ